MNPLTEREILLLLDVTDAERIRECFADRLDGEGLRLLDREEHALKEAASLLEATGRDFRRTVDVLADTIPLQPAGHLPEQEHDQGTRRGKGEPDRPKIPEPEHREPGALRRGRVSWFKGSLVAAAVLLVGLTSLVVNLLHDRGRSITLRGSTEMADLQPVNEKLFEGFLERGGILMRAGDVEASKDLWQEALANFMWAYELEGNHRGLLEQLAMVHERLGNRKEAEKYLAKARALPE